MAHFIDDDPEMVAHFEHHRQHGRYVPIAWAGGYYGMAHRDYIDAFTLDEPLSVESYVTGLELLGYRFEVASDYIVRWEPKEAMPEAWTSRAHALMTAFGRESLRNADIAEFIVTRERRAAA